MEKSNKFLKVTGILMIISGSFALLSSILVLLFGVVLVEGAIHTNLTRTQDFAVGIIVAALVLVIAGSVIQFIAGLVGVKNAKNPEKANVCIIFGVLVALVYLVSLVLNLIGGGYTIWMDVLVVIFGMVVPALYLVGAFQLKAKEE